MCVCFIRSYSSSTELLTESTPSCSWFQVSRSLQICCFRSSRNLKYLIKDQHGQLQQLVKRGAFKNSFRVLMPSCQSMHEHSNLKDFVTSGSVQLLDLSTSVKLTTLTCAETESPAHGCWGIIKNTLHDINCSWKRQKAHFVQSLPVEQGWVHIRETGRRTGQQGAKLVQLPHLERLIDECNLRQHLHSNKQFLLLHLPLMEFNRTFLWLDSG